MGLLAQYGSDSESDHDEQPIPIASSSKPALAQKSKKPVKIGFHHPLLDNGTSDDDDDGRPSKRAKIDEKPQPKSGSLPKGKGSSALLSMLPPPTRTLPKPKEEPKAAETQSKEAEDSVASLMPRAVKSKAKEPAPRVAAGLDLFGVSSASVERAGTPSAPAPAATATPPSLSITSAPDAPDYVPPPPSVEDPYPGYYQLPSGQWAAYDPEYYMSFFKAMSNKDRIRDMAEQGAGGHGWSDVSQLAEGEVTSYNVKNDMDKSRLELEAAKNKAPAKAYVETNYRVSIGMPFRCTSFHALTASLSGRGQNHWHR